MNQTMNDKKNKPQFISVPFKASSPNGMTEYNGIAKFSPAGIVVEFDSKLFGLISGEVKEVRIALDEILDIRFRKGIYKFFAQVQFRLQSFSKLSELPNDSGKVKLKIKRADFELAQKAVANLQKDLTGEHEFLPPTHAPLSLFDESEDETKKLDR
jgi:phenylalanine-4-hydroxylase